MRELARHSLLQRQGQKLPTGEKALKAWSEGTKRGSIEKRLGLRVWSEEEEARNIKKQLE